MRDVLVASGPMTHAFGKGDAPLLYASDASSRVPPNAYQPSMTPRTRTSNQSANFKVYYSKKVPQQVYFPHKKKTVHRPHSTEQDGVDKRQVRFLPKMMRQQKIEDEGELQESEVGLGSALQKVTNGDAPKSTPVHRRKSKKRESKDVQEG